MRSRLLYRQITLTWSNSPRVRTWIQEGGHLQLLAEEAPGAIGTRWTEQGRIQEGRNTTQCELAEDTPNGMAVTVLSKIDEDFSIRIRVNL